MINKKFLIGLDLAQKNDYSVLSILKTGVTPRASSRMPYSLVYLYKFPLKTSYPTIVTWITDTILQQPVLKDRVTLVVDYTGVGAPVVDLFREKDTDLIAITITGGNSANWKKGYAEATVPKKELISSLFLTLVQKRLTFLKSLREREDLQREFLNFKYEMSHSRNVKYEAASSFHDDIVLSISLAIWYGEAMSKPYGKLKTFVV